MRYLFLMLLVGCTVWSPKIYDCVDGIGFYPFKSATIMEREEWNWAEMSYTYRVLETTETSKDWYFGVPAREMKPCKLD